MEIAAFGTEQRCKPAATGESSVSGAKGTVAFGVSEQGDADRVGINSSAGAAEVGFRQGDKPPPTSEAAFEQRDEPAATREALASELTGELLGSAVCIPVMEFLRVGFVQKMVKRLVVLVGTAGATEAQR